MTHTEFIYLKVNECKRQTRLTVSKISTPPLWLLPGYAR